MILVCVAVFIVDASLPPVGKVDVAIAPSIPKRVYARITDPFDRNSVYDSCQMVLHTTNAGVSWTEDSPDLSTKDPFRIILSGGIVGDNLR